VAAAQDPNATDQSRGTRDCWLLLLLLPLRRHCRAQRSAPPDRDRSSPPWRPRPRRAPPPVSPPTRPHCGGSCSSFWLLWTFGVIWFNGVAGGSGVQGERTAATSATSAGTSTPARTPAPSTAARTRRTAVTAAAVAAPSRRPLPPPPPRRRRRRRTSPRARSCS
jgi:hypothetical protein